MTLGQPGTQRGPLVLPNSPPAKENVLPGSSPRKGVPPSPIYSWRGGQSLFWQATGLVAVCLYVYSLHFNNDGLWFQGDSPRHAANGLFWWDLLSEFPVHPVQF